MEQKKNYTLPIVMMFLLFAMISFVTGLSNPLGVIVKNQFAVANWMSQLGNFANFIAYAVMGIPAGMMLKRIGYKKTALAAVAVGFVEMCIRDRTHTGRCRNFRMPAGLCLRRIWTPGIPRNGVARIR